MSFVALKNVKKETWQLFKSESARHGMNMSEFFEELMSDHARKHAAQKKAWDRVLNHKPLLKPGEVDELQKAISEFRAGFRLTKS